MNDQQIGTAFRAVRIRRRLRQRDVARIADVSPTTISRLERGHFEYLSLVTLRRVAVVQDVRLGLVARWRGGELDRLINAKHAALHESVARAFATLAGWQSRPEVSFAIYGERGIVDVLAWHSERRALLVIELKTDIVDINELIGSVDRKRRLARAIARDFGWTPTSVSAWVVVAEGRTNRRRIAEHRAVLHAAFPGDRLTIRDWLAAPGPPIAVISTWSVARTQSNLAPTKRVRVRRGDPAA